MQFKSNFKNNRFVKYAVVLAAAAIARIVFAIFTPIESQKYISLIIIVLAIAAFFIWDYIGRSKDKE